MSKIGKMPIAVPEGVTITIASSGITVTGSKGELQFVVPSDITVVQEEGQLLVSPKIKEASERSKTINALFGLVRAQLANMVKGVSEGFAKKLELTGVGYRAQVQGSDLVLSVGYSHQVKIKAQPGISFTFADGIITVLGINKETVGDTAAKIRAVRPPEPYKGKGIAYVGERIRRKAGKAAKAVGGK